MSDEIGTELEKVANRDSVLLFLGLSVFVMVSNLFSSLFAGGGVAWLGSFGAPLLGGALIGGAAALLLATLGRVAGISGIVGTLFSPPRSNTVLEVGWRSAFLAGLVGVGLLTSIYDVALITNDAPRSWLTLVAAGLLVGFGTRLGSGCTSGHGVCGISRFSPRSIVATCTFIGTGALTVLLVRALGGGV